MSHLFSKIVITDAIKNIDIPDISSKIAIIQWWLDMYNAGSLQKKSEKEFEWVYNESLFGYILGYTSIQNTEYTREKEPRNESNGQKCDIGLGFYAADISDTQAIVELKDAVTSLDRPQQRAGNLTPVQQAFKYKPLYNSKWVIVSNFFEIRLYTDTYQDFESFTLRELVDPQNNYENFYRFYTLFHRDALIQKIWESKTEHLLAKVRIDEEKISKEFYKHYKDLRLELMRNIWKNNPETRNADVIEKAQRIIDRIVFICFCEDRWLLPQNKLKENIIRSKESDFTPWEVLKKFFQWIDLGSEKLGIPNGYNGGLFRADPAIDALIVDDAIIEQFVALGDYDFTEDGGQLSVEILGHIFEQSISDIEEIRTQIENQGKLEEEKQTEQKVSKRKKDGIFYTPAYIVNYIVENSLGRYLREHEDSLKEKYALKEDINEKNYRKREIDAYMEYQKILQNVKVLDPACGSGAFLVRVFDYLKDENIRVDRILNGENNTISMIEADANAFYAEILKNNIYGVDLNEESVEITKLSLWLKSAVRGKKLVTLDNNIKCGNSLIDDRVVAGDKAFDWNIEFADIMASGWFDVIVGNPPYVKESTNRNAFEGLHNHSCYQGKMDLWYFFTWLGLEIVKKETWLVGYIAPNNWITNDGASNMRNKISNSAKIIEFIDFADFKVFDSAWIQTMICILRRSMFNQEYSFKYSKIIDSELSLNEVQNFLLNVKSDKHISYMATFDKEKFTNTIFSFPNKFNELLLNKIESKNNFHLKKDEIFSGIDIGQDFVNAKSQSVLGIGINIGDGVFNLSEKEFNNYNFSLEEKALIKPFYTTKEIGRYYSRKKNDFWVIYTPSKFKNSNEITPFPKIKNHLDRFQKIITSDNKPYGLHRTRNEKIFKGEKILSIRKCLYPTFSYTDFNTYVNRTFNIIQTNRLNLKYLTAILNSSLVKFWLKEKGKMQWDIFQVDINPLISIPLIIDNDTIPFIERADTMLSLNKELHEKGDAFLKNISTKYHIEKITRKLEKWWELDFAGFIKELKVSISLEEQEELMNYFEKRASEVREIVSRIETTDKEIDEMVFELYGLTEEERRVVLEA